MKILNTKVVQTETTVEYLVKFSNILFNVGLKM